jgi:hypothetical protein
MPTLPIDDGVMDNDIEPDWGDDFPPQPDTPPWELDWKLISGLAAEPAASSVSLADAVASDDGDTLPDWDDLPRQDGDDAQRLESQPGAANSVSGSATIYASAAPVPPVVAAPDLMPKITPARIEPLPDIVPTPPVINPPARRPAADGGAPRPDAGLSYLVSPHQPGDADGEVRMLTVVLRSSGDTTRDVLRLRRIHGIILSYPGSDRFALQAYERGRFFLLEFPNSGCGICQDLLDRLRPLVGEENMRIEKITFQ